VCRIVAFSKESEGNLKIKTVLLTIFTILCSTVLSEEEKTENPVLELEASKDTFMRSNKKHRNNGASPQLFLMQTPMARAIISFDLSGVTNEVLSAEFQICQDNTVSEHKRLDLIICPMVQTDNNAAWGEGQGNLAIGGHPAQIGEATFVHSAFNTIKWESADGNALAFVTDSKLWKSSAADLKNVAWKEGNWIKAPINTTLVEDIRTSKTQQLTLGIWGTGGGREFYYLRSKESGDAPKLVLELKPEEKEDEEQK
jgi:hypothetical protein